LVEALVEGYGGGIWWRDLVKGNGGSIGGATVEDFRGGMVVGFGGGVRGVLLTN